MRCVWEFAFGKKCWLCSKRYSNEGAVVKIEALDGLVERKICDECSADMKRVTDVGEAMRRELGAEGPDGGADRG